MKGERPIDHMLVAFIPFNWQVGKLNLAVLFPLALRSLSNVWALGKGVGGRVRMQTGCEFDKVTR